MQHSSKDQAIALINAHLRGLQRRELLPDDQEICGYCDGTEVVQLRNVAPNGETFCLTPQDAAIALQKGSVIWHTHTKNGWDTLSHADVGYARAWAKPIYMVKPSNGLSDYYDPLELRPYEGRAWNWVYSNCWNLAQDFLLREFGIKTSDYKLTSANAYESPDWDMWRENLKTEGFYPVKLAEAQRGDLAVMAVKAPNPNHCGVIYSTEDNTLLHQLAGGLSRPVPFDEKWRSRLWPDKHVWRHKKAPNL